MFQDCYFETTPTLYLCLMYVIGICVLPINLFGTYCVVKKTPSHLVEYRKTLLYYQLCVSIPDFLISLAFTPVLFIPFPIHKTMGIMSILNMKDVNCLASCMALLLQAFCATFQLFHYRLNVILPHDSCLRWRRETFLIARFIFSVLVVSPMFLLPGFYNEEDSLVYRAYIAKTYDCVGVVLNDPEVQLTDGNLNKYMYMYVGIAAVTIWFFSATLAFSTYLVMRRMKATSEKTHHLQQKFQLVLILQAVFPIVVIGIPGWILILLYVTDGYVPQWLAHLFMMCLSIHGLVGNLIMIIFNSEYYRFAKETLTNLMKCKINISQGNNF